MSYLPLSFQSSEFEPVVLSGFDAKPVWIELLGRLTDLEFLNANLRGGALRDLRMNNERAINDLDIEANLAEPLPGQRQQIDAALLERMASLDGVDRSSISVTRTFEGRRAGHIDFDYKGNKVEMQLVARSFPRLWGDAPINTVALDASGRAVAHPLFEDHADGRIWQSFGSGPVIFERFIRISKKTPGLTYHGNVDNIGAISELPPSLKIVGGLDLTRNTRLAALPIGLQVDGNVNLFQSKVRQLGDFTRINGDLITPDGESWNLRSLKITQMFDRIQMFNNRYGEMRAAELLQTSGATESGASASPAAQRSTVLDDGRTPLKTQLKPS